MSGKGREEGVSELQEGIERIRRMTRVIAEAHDLVAANNDLLSRDRDLIQGGPLHDSRDLRPCQSPATREEVGPRQPAGARRRRR